jgi:hypothetical protein
VVLPPSQDAAADAPIEVYLLRNAQVRGDIPIGVHQRVLVSPDSARVLRAEPLSCFDLTLQGSCGEPPQEILVSHLSSEVPTEIHIYLSLKHGRPIEVAAIPSNACWRVDGDKIAFLRFLQR